MFTHIVDLIISGWLVVLPVMLLVTIFVKKRFFRISVAVCLTISVILVVTQPSLIVPVKGATSNDWNPKTFWYEPWGKSIVHRGIDIFAKSGADVIAPTEMIVIYAGTNPVSGYFVLGFDRSFRVHFFAHLRAISTTRFDILYTGEKIGENGNTGNAAGKPPHLHYGLASLVPQFWEMTGETLGHLRAFYLNPIEFFEP